MSEHSMPERNLEDDRQDDPHGPTCGCRECEALTEPTLAKWPADDSHLLIDASDPDDVEDDRRADYEEWLLENGGHRCPECNHVVAARMVCWRCDPAELPGADDARDSGRAE